MRRNRGRHRTLSTEGRRPPAAYGADELERFLVEDAVAGRLTELKWATGAYLRIGRLRKVGTEQAFLQVDAKVRELTGRGMPL